VSRVPLLRPEFGPSLPELVSGRFALSRRLVGVIAVIALIVLAVVIKLAIDDGREKLTVHGKPSFNVLYEPDQLHRVAPHPGELARLEGRRARVSTEITVRRANLPPYSGDVIGGQLPLYTAQYAERLKSQLPGFALGTEGKARLNKAPGYQIAYTSGTPGNRTDWLEVFLMPKADEADQTVVIKMRQTFTGRPGRRGRALLKATKKAFRSFRFGTGRPLFQGG
jgi:hypothetical protein